MAPDPKLQKQAADHRREATRLKREAAQERSLEEAAERKTVEYESQARKLSLDIEVRKAQGDAARARAETHVNEAESARSVAKTAREMAARLETDAKAIESSDPNKAADLREEAAANRRSSADALTREQHHEKLAAEARTEVRHHTSIEIRDFKKYQELWSKRDGWEKKAEIHETKREQLETEAKHHEQEATKIDGRTSLIDGERTDGTAVASAAAADDDPSLIADPDRLDDLADEGSDHDAIASAEQPGDDLFDDATGETHAVAVAEEPSLTGDLAIDPPVESQDVIPAIAEEPEQIAVAVAEPSSSEATEMHPVEEMADVVDV